MPTVFCAVLEPFKVIKGGQDRFIVKILHVRDKLFLVGTADKEVELSDFSTEPPTVIRSMSFPDVEGALLDIDFLRDESFVIIGFRGDQAVVVDMKQGQLIRNFDNRLPEPLILIQALRHYSGNSFLALSRAGTLRFFSADDFRS